MASKTTSRQPIRDPTDISVASSRRNSVWTSSAIEAGKATSGGRIVSVVGEKNRSSCLRNAGEAAS